MAHLVQQIVAQLTASWIWVDGWTDASSENTAGSTVEFTKSVDLAATPTEAPLHISADTRYKLFVNGQRVAVGPARGSAAVWHYDSLDLLPYLAGGRNDIRVVVLRYFAASRAAMPFARTAFPGLTAVGGFEVGSDTVRLRTDGSWGAESVPGIRFPTGLVDDVFLHVHSCIPRDRGVMV